MSSPGRALAAWYAATAGSLALGPWMAVLLTDTGVTRAEASALLLAVPICRLIGGPVWAWIADRSGPYRVLRAGMVSGVLASAAVLVASGPVAVSVAIVAWALSRAPAFPIVDATTVELVGRRYGRVRAIGSIAFLAATVANGLVRDVFQTGPAWIATGLAAIAVWLTVRLPPLVVTPSPPTLGSLGRLARHPVLVPLVVVCVLHGAALSVYDHLFAVHVEALGLPSTVTGFGVATGVAVEVGVLALGDRLLQRLGPVALLVAGVAAGVPRFVGIALTDEPVALVAIQAFHGLQFGAFWIATTAMFAEEAPADLRHSTQALLPAATFGAGPLIGLLAGSATLAHGTTGTLYLGMATVSAAATVIAAGALSRRGSRCRPRG